MGLLSFFDSTFGGKARDVSDSHGLPVTLSGSITPQQTEVSVGATTTVVLAANADRKYALFINDSNEAIYLKLGADAELNKGIRINADGGSYEMSAGLGNLYTGAINSICTSGSKTLLVTEGE